MTTQASPDSQKDSIISGSQPRKTRYAVVGTGGRCRMFTNAILGRYKAHAGLVALCDLNPQRLEYTLECLKSEYAGEGGAIKGYGADSFERMIAETQVDTVIVCTMDRTHHDYIIRAMRAGCDVITEKPMTVDIPKCQAIMDTVKATGKKVKVTFNYRYAPSRTKVKELLQDGAIGQVLSVHFEWLLDTQHGADYFRRWHRDKRNSGGLMVHKSTHHFDLVNWWLGSVPETVFGFGQLGFYGRANAEARGEYRPYYRATGSAAAKEDLYGLQLDDGGNLENLYLKAEQHDGYLRDQNVFGDCISIEDTMNVLVRYRNGAQMSYSLTAYSPWEGLRIAFNGTKGRIELLEVERPYINAGGSSEEEGASDRRTLTLQKLWEKPEVIAIEEAVGGHGGGDVKMLDDIFAPTGETDPYGRAAGHIDGALSILTGIAANKSFATGQPVEVNSDEIIRRSV